MGWTKKSGIILATGLVAIGIVLIFQNCEKKRNVVTTDQGSNNPVIAPSSVCHNNMVQSGDWTARWGTMSQNGAVSPPYNGCGAGVTSLLSDPTNEINRFGKVIWTLGTISYPRMGYMKRNFDISFLIPAAALTDFHHVVVAPSFNNASMGRIGAAVYRDKVAIEIYDPACFGQNSLFAPINLNDGTNDIDLQGEHWYRLHTQIKDLGNAGLQVKGILVDMATTATIGTTTFGVTCIPGWYRGGSNSWLAGATSQTNPGTTTDLQINFADASASAN